METGYKRILLGLGGTAGDRSCGALAFTLAKRLRADVQAWLIRPEAEDPAVLVANGFAGKAFRRLASSVEAHAGELETVARAAFEAGRKSHPSVPAEFRVPEGGRLHTLVEAARIVDLAVLPHPKLMSVRYYRHAVEHLVTYSGRPLLLLPGHLPADAMQHIVLLWKDDARAATALSLCRPLLRLARQVTVLAITEPDQSVGFPDQAKEYLAAHGIQATAVSKPRDGRRVDEAIDAQAHELGATLLIGGATLNGRIRDWLHTSVTGHALHDLRLPVVLVG
jgi:nucleotide-binding universal stress UspA family protein